jgi:hypothetical protein
MMGIHGGCEKREEGGREESLEREMRCRDQESG